MRRAAKEHAARRVAPASAKRAPRAQRAGGRRTPTAGRASGPWPAVVAAAALVVGLASGTAGAQPAAAGAEGDAWAHLERLRDALAAAPHQAEFVQTFLPAGFSTGERESGSLALALPDCLRWDYGEPFPKSFLLCGDAVHTWNEGETSGRRTAIEPGEAQGLDLVKLSVEDLRRRYAAALAPGDPGGEPEAVTVVLTPRVPGGEITEARFTLDPAIPRLTALAYRDVEGNQTRFEFARHRPLGSRAPFSPPDLAWLED